jgi:replication factor A1
VPQCAVSFPEPSYRFVLPVTITDCTQGEEVTLFNESACELLGVTADTMLRYREDEEKGAALWSSVLHAAMFRTFLFRVRVKVPKGARRRTWG